jgi:phosphate starvation-inducible PhoH-like protein
LSRKARAATAQKKEVYVENTIKLDIAPRSRRSIEADLVPKTLTQERYITHLLNPEKNIVAAYGPAGTGKTYLAMLAAIRALRKGECSRIVLTRPAVGVEEEEHGFLPGDLNAKMEPWTRPLFDVLREYYPPREILRMLEEQIVEIAPLAFMRGRTFTDAWIVFDESQNSTINQMKMLLTRIGPNSKIVVTGDLNQLDRKFCKDNGLLDFVARCKKTPSSRIATIEYSLKDVQRHPAVVEVLKMYGE